MADTLKAEVTLTINGPDFEPRITDVADGTASCIWLARGGPAIFFFAEREANLTRLRDALTAHLDEIKHL